jgi:cation diffusion facilitator CzcD-associated flavoprotein CzcO
LDNFTAVMIGREVDCDLTDDGWTHHMAAVSNPPRHPGISFEERMRIVEETDFAIMESHRSRVDDLVSDRRVAEILKPYYRYLCKRPCFHDEYLQTFNYPNVTLVDCPGGVERVTPKGVVLNGAEIELDCLIFATGFEAESTPLPRKAGHPIIGLRGVSLADKWKDGVRSLHGVATRGFPNLFLMPGPRQQAVATVNYTHIVVEGAKHIGATVALLEQQGIKRFEVTGEAEARWGETILSSYVDNSAFLSACTPSRFNFEGNPGAANPRNSNYGGGVGDLFGYRALLAEWRERGDFEGWELRQGT